MKIPNPALAYREAASLGASPVSIVVLLYDRLVQDIHDAVSAMKRLDVEARAVHVNHSLLILEQLQGRLDFAAGGSAARQLDTFYSVVRGKLLEAQIRQSPELLLKQAQTIIQVRESWAEIERGSSEAAAPIAPSAPDMPEPSAAPSSWGAQPGAASLSHRTKMPGVKPGLFSPSQSDRVSLTFPEGSSGRDETR